MQKQPFVDVLQNRCSKKFRNFTEKHLYRSLFIDKVAGMMSATLLKKRLQHRCFLVNFAKFLTPNANIIKGRITKNGNLPVITLIF